MPPPAPLSSQTVPPRISESSMVVTVLLFWSGKAVGGLVALTVPVFCGLTISWFIWSSMVASHWMVTV